MTHDPHTPEGRDGLARVIAYEARRFHWVRPTVAQRLLDALQDQHARPSMSDPTLAREFDEIACSIANGDVADVAIRAVRLVEMARGAA